MKAKILFLLFSFFSLYAFATHMRSGEITYKCLGGYTYEITLTTYTKGSISAGDRCYEQINFGDDTTHYFVCRCNYETGDPTTDPWGASCSGVPNCSTHHMGEWTMFPICLDVKRNVYCVTHTFSGPGNYIISFFEPNRMDGIVNIPNQTPFYIADTLNISPFITCASSPVFINSIPDTAHVGFCYSYNQSATDPDGDSLSYKLISCMDSANHPITGYFIPSGVTMNAVTGDMTWCSPPNLSSPPATDFYNFAIQIKKWRKISSNYIVVGTVMRDIQIFVEACAAMAVNDINSELPSINIYPNPTSGIFNAQMSKFENEQIKIYNIYGECIHQHICTSANQQIDLSAAPSGIYFLHVKTAEGITVKKIVKE